MAKISDGTGAGYDVKVTSSNKLVTLSEVVSGISVASLTREDAYVINSNGSIALTSGQSALCYVVNQSEAPLSIAGIDVSNDAGGVWTLHRQPSWSLTGGSLTPVQLNFSSSKAFSGTTTLGANGDSASGGTILATGYTAAGFTQLPLQGAVILGTSDSFGLSFTASASTNVTFNVIAAFLD